jgi:hypothetical protein
MTGKTPFAIFAALLLASGPLIGRAQDFVDPADSAGTVEVTAQREAMRKAIRHFVDNVTRFDGENVSRWLLPICAAVTRAPAEQAAFLHARILDLARSVGAPLAPDQEKCEANLVVMLMSHPDQWWAVVLERNPWSYRLLSPQSVARAVSTRPVQTMQNFVMNSFGSTTSFDTASYRPEDSHIYTSATADFATAIVVVDDAEIGDATLAQLADYVSMVALARVDLSADFTGADSILRLFAAADPASPPPPKLTAWDQSFLRTLYGVDASEQRPRTLISDAMIEDLVH